MEYHNCDYANVGYDEAEGFTYMVIKRKGDSEHFRMAHYKTLELYDGKRPGKHLADTSKMGVVSIEDQQFIANKVIPQLLKMSPDHKLKIAVLVSDEVFSNVAVKSIVNKSKQGNHDVDHSVFNNYEQAINWLRSDN
ncbi:hypothetical protein QQ020_16165 [Fulvivirgaceae bacterium BMA12]|uniref:STAS/SEC14 domain-containing protein n=1 Tax=Agaribacillus aureus TaxID=3051825 RepID=A0ABT8L7D1_9BACT|nr:hypothetical protein [Fulvivirgaceae bacterium BMA12]